MCESAASHTALRRFVSVRARFAHNSLMRRGLLFKLFNSRERPLGLGAVSRSSCDPPGRVREGFRVIHGNHRATKWIRSRIFVPRSTTTLTPVTLSRAQSLFCIPRFLRNNKLQVANSENLEEECGIYKMRYPKIFSNYRIMSKISLKKRSMHLWKNIERSINRNKSQNCV